MEQSSIVTLEKVNRLTKLVLENHKQAKNTTAKGVTVSIYYNIYNVHFLGRKAGQRNKKQFKHGKKVSSTICF